MPGSIYGGLECELRRYGVPASAGWTGLVRGSPDRLKPGLHTSEIRASIMPAHSISQNPISTRPSGEILARRRSARQHCRFTATGLHVMCVQADSICTASAVVAPPRPCGPMPVSFMASRKGRSEEHTSELQSQSNLVCRLLLEKKKTRLPQ